MIEDLIGTLVGGDLRIRNFHANVDALLFGVALHAAQDGDCVIGALFPGHASALAGNCDQSRAPHADAHVDTGMRRCFNLVVDFLANQTSRKTGSRARHQSRRQTVLREDRHLLGGGQIHALESNARENLAPLFKRSRRAHPPNRRHHALLNAGAHRRRGLGGQLISNPRDQGHSQATEECSSFHARQYTMRMPRVAVPAKAVGRLKTRSRSRQLAVYCVKAKIQKVAVRPE